MRGCGERGGGPWRQCRTRGCPRSLPERAIPHRQPSRPFSPRTPHPSLYLTSTLNPHPPRTCITGVFCALLVSLAPTTPNPSLTSFVSLPPHNFGQHTESWYLNNSYHPPVLLLSPFVSVSLLRRRLSHSTVPPQYSSSPVFLLPSSHCFCTP